MKQKAKSLKMKKQFTTGTSIHKNRLKGFRVLLVEDNITNQELVLTILEEAGLIIKIANNGKEALAAVHESQFDAVLMDIQMPVMDGYEATREIRKDAEFNNLSIIAMTAHALQEDEEKYLKAGMNGFVPKPATQDMLLNALWQELKNKDKSDIEEAKINASDRISAQNILDAEKEVLPTNLPGINIKKALEEFKLNAAVFKHILAGFLKNNHNIMKRIKDAFKGKEMDKLIALAHNIKGSSANIGAILLCEAAKKLEDASRDEKPEIIISELIDQFEAALNQVLESLKILDKTPEIMSLEKTDVDEIKDSLVLIVDDNSTNIDMLVGSLKGDYRLGIARNGFEAIDYAQEYLPDLILLDVIMPAMNGYDVCRRLKADYSTKPIPVIFITALTEADHKTRGFEVGGVDYITKPFNSDEVKARIKTHISLKKMRETLKNQNITLEERVKEKTAQIEQMLSGIIQTMGVMVDVKDPYTAGHQHRVAKLACAIAEKLSLSDDVIRTIQIAGILHDIGKLRIPTSILNRPGTLLDVEIQMIRMHSQVGYDILKNIPSPWPFAKVVLQHHEKLDGSGFPFGLKDNEIMLEAKILTVADVAEATSSYRPYRPAFDIEYSLEELLKNRDKKYYGKAVDACVELFRKDKFRFE